jgi:hypothetical protein
VSDLRNIPPAEKNDLQTVNLFVILAVLTGLFVLGLRLVLFAPNLDLKTGVQLSPGSGPSAYSQPLREGRAQK